MLSHTQRLFVPLDPGPAAFLSGQLPELLPVYPEFRDTLLEALIEDGRVTNISGHAALNEPTFKSLEKGRGPAFVAAFGPEAVPMYNAAHVYANQYIAAKYSDKKWVKGIRQTSADVLFIAHGDESVSLRSYVNLQRRVVAGYLMLFTRKHNSMHLAPDIQDRLRQLITGQGWELPDSEFASCPPGALTWMTNLFNKENPIPEYIPGDQDSE